MNSPAVISLIVLALMAARGHTAPVSCYNDNSTDVTLNNSTTTNATAVSTNITVLQVVARADISSVYQEIKELENYTVRHQTYPSVIVEYMCSYSHVCSC